MLRNKKNKKTNKKTPNKLNIGPQGTVAFREEEKGLEKDKEGKEDPSWKKQEFQESTALQTLRLKRWLGEARSTQLGAIMRLRRPKRTDCRIWYWEVSSDFQKPNHVPQA